MAIRSIVGELYLGVFHLFKESKGVKSTKNAKKSTINIISININNMITPFFAHLFNIDLEGAV